MARSADSRPSRTTLSRLGGALLLGAAAVGLVVLVTTTPPDELWPLLASAVGIGVTCGAFTLGSKLVSNQGLSWRAILWGAAKWLTVLIVALVTIEQLLDSTPNPMGRFNALFVTALSCASLAYLLFVSSRVRLSLPGIDERIREQGRSASMRREKKSMSAGQEEDVITLQVSRLDSNVARTAIVNDAPLPVLRAEASLDLTPDTEGQVVPDTAGARRVTGSPFSIRARGSRPATLSRAFDHVGIFRLHTATVRVYDLFGLLSRVRGIPGQWRVRVVPNIYRLAYGIPKERRAVQDSLGIPETPADALDYDRVRGYRPGDPLKTIHWKLVAHSQGELYTKLFETPTVTAMTLLLDPHGAVTGSDLTDAACHLYDTMLEGGFSLIEHARENGIAGRLRFVDRSGTLVESSWEGPGMLGPFVEMAQRPLGSRAALSQSVASIRSLRDSHAGYKVFATCGLTSESVEELISCHRAGVPLLVVHALPAGPRQERSRQRSFDVRLRDASIGVIELEDGPQIVREVIAS